MVVKGPMVFGICSEFRVGGSELACGSKINFSCQRVVSAQKLHGVVMTGSLIGAMDDVAPNLEIMPAPPMLSREEVIFLHLLLGTGARPRVEEVAKPTHGSYLKVCVALSVRVAVKIRELRHCGQDAPTGEQIVIVGPN